MDFVSTSWPAVLDSVAHKQSMNNSIHAQRKAGIDNILVTVLILIEERVGERSF